MLKLIVYALPLILAVYALVDCIQTSTDEIRHLPRIGWIALIVLVWVVGPLAWLIAGRRRGRPGRVAPGRGSPGPLAPDDDPDFLRRLDAERRRREREQRRRGEPEGGGGPAGDSPPG
jgi:hypothetical protein